VKIGRSTPRDDLLVRVMSSEKTADRGLSIAITFPYSLGSRNGGSTSLFQTAMELSRLGAKVALLPVSSDKWTSFPRRPVAGELLGKDRQALLEAQGVEVVRVAPHRLSQWMDGRSVALALRRLAQRRRIDVVLGTHHEASKLAQTARALGLRFGMIALWQSYELALGLRPKRRGLRARVIRRLGWRVVAVPLRSAEIVFATSEFTRGELLDFVGVDPGRVRICRQGIDPVFDSVPRRHPRAVERLLFFGRLVKAKGIGDAIEALGLVAAGGNRDWRFRVMGEGDAAAVRRLARRHGIEDRVEVLPFQGTEALLRELEEADLALMPSHSESFGLSIGEAQAAGVPVVAYHCGSVPEIVQDGISGWLAPFGDTEELSRHIANATSDPEGTFRAGLLGREHLRGRFTWEKTARRIVRGLEGS